MNEPGLRVIRAYAIAEDKIPSSVITGGFVE